MSSQRSGVSPEARRHGEPRQERENRRTPTSGQASRLTGPAALRGCLSRSWNSRAPNSTNGSRPEPDCKDAIRKANAYADSAAAMIRHFQDIHAKVNA